MVGAAAALAADNKDIACTAAAVVVPSRRQRPPCRRGRWCECGRRCARRRGDACCGCRIGEIRRGWDWSGRWSENVGKMLGMERFALEGQLGGEVSNAAGGGP